MTRGMCVLPNSELGDNVPIKLFINVVHQLIHNLLPREAGFHIGQTRGQNDFVLSVP